MSNSGIVEYLEMQEFSEFKNYSNYYIARKEENPSLFTNYDFVTSELVDNDRGFAFYTLRWKEKITVNVLDNNVGTQVITGNVIYPTFYNTYNKSDYTFIIIKEKNTPEKEDILKAIKLNQITLNDVNLKYKNDSDVVKTAITQNPKNILYVLDEIAYEFIKTNGLLLEFVQQHLKEDIEFVKLAVTNNLNAFKYAGEFIKHNPLFYLQTISSVPRIFEYVPTELKHDIEFISEALTKSIRIISDIPDEIKEHAIIKPKITEMCIKFPYIFKDLSDNMKQDYTYILYLVSQNGNILQYLTKEQQNDYNIVMTCVAQNGNTLHHVSKTFKNNKDIVLTAVMQNSDALYYASEELKNNYAIVLTAVAQNGHALKYASDNLKENYNIVMTAYTQTKYALSHLNKTQLTKFKERAK